MKTIVRHTYGSPDVLKVTDVEVPRPGASEVLLRVHAASVNPYDWHFMRGTPYAIRLIAGLVKPKDVRLGADVAGEIAAVGAEVKDLKPGDAVFGMCKGAFAQYTCTTASALAVVPGNVSFEAAASVPIAGLTALQALRDKGHIQPGHRVLVNGASGGVGTFAIQIAKSFGTHVTAVCSSANIDMVRSIGADRVIDYTQQDFTTLGDRYDLVLDCIGNHSLRALRGVLSNSGICVMVGGKTGDWMIGALARGLCAALLSLFGNRKILSFLAKARRADLEILSGWLASGTLRPVIDRRYSLADLPEAVRYLETGHAHGKVVIAIEPESNPSRTAQEQPLRV